MENKKKIILIDEEDIEREYLLLSESQLRLLNFLKDNDYLCDGFTYECVANEVNWKEI